MSMCVCILNNNEIVDRNDLISLYSYPIEKNFFFREHCDLYLQSINFHSNSSLIFIFYFDNYNLVRSEYDNFPFDKFKWTQKDR